MLRSGILSWETFRLKSFRECEVHCSLKKSEPTNPSELTHMPTLFGGHIRKISTFGIPVLVLKTERKRPDIPEGPGEIVCSGMFSLSTLFDQLHQFDPLWWRASFEELTIWMFNKIAGVYGFCRFYECFMWIAKVEHGNVLWRDSVISLMVCWIPFILQT